MSSIAGRTRFGLRAVSAVVVLTFLSTSSPADERNPSMCKFYFAGESLVPPSVKQVMTKFGDVAARTCVNRSIITLYESITAARAGSNNVCTFTKEARPPDPGKPETFMMLAQAACPKQNDERYTLTDTGISEGAFAALVKFANQMASSGRDFDSAFASAAPDRDRISYQEIREAMVRVSSTNRFRIAFIQSGNLAIGPPVSADYTLTFWQRPFCGRTWMLAVDQTSDGFKVVAFEGLDIMVGPDHDKSCPKL